MNKHFISILVGTLLSLSSVAFADVDKTQPVTLVSPYSTTGGVAGLGAAVTKYLESQGWTNINGGAGFKSAGGCANLVNIVDNSEGPVFYLLENGTLAHGKEHPCYVESVDRSKFVNQFAGWTSYICSRKDLDLPPIDEATGTIRIAVDTKEYFTDFHMSVLEQIAHPDADVVALRYGGSGGALQAVQAKEVDYTWSMLFGGKRSDYALTCDYNTSTTEANGTVPVSEAFPDIELNHPTWIPQTWVWLMAENADADLITAMSEDIQGAFDNDKDTIKLHSLRGYLKPTLTSNLSENEIADTVGPKLID